MARMWGTIFRESQYGSKRAGSRADQNVNKKVNNEVDKSVDKAFDKLWGEDQKKEDNSESGDASENPSASPSKKTSDARDQAATNAMMKKMGISTNVDVNENYQYSGNIVMTVQTWDENGETEGQIHYTTYINKDNSGFAMNFSQPESGSSTMIFDYKEGENDNHE